MKRRQYWAIKVLHGYIGVYWFDYTFKAPPFAGCTTALFKTRALARAQMPLVKPHWTEAKIVRVEIREVR